MNCKQQVEGNLATWYKFTFVVGCKCDSKSICYRGKELNVMPGSEGILSLRWLLQWTNCCWCQGVDSTLSYFYTGLFEHVWDPLSQKQTTLAIKLIRGMAEVYPNFQAQNKTTQVKNINRQNNLSVFICTCLSSVNSDAPIVWSGPINKVN